MTTYNYRTQQRGGLKADLMAGGDTPLEREIIVAYDTLEMWIGDGITPLSQLTSIGVISVDETTGLATLPDGSQLPTIDSASYLFPDAVMQALEARFGGGGSGLSYDSTTGFYDVSDSSSLTYDATTGLYQTA